MLKDYKKATKKEISTIDDVVLVGVPGGCTWDDLYSEFEKINGIKIEEVKNNWICCNNGKRYKMLISSYIFNYDGFLRF